MTMLPEQVESFSARLRKLFSTTIPASLLIPQIAIDAVISFKELTNGFFNMLGQMEPFGPENMRPVFLSRHVADLGYSKIVKNDHIRFALNQDGKSFSGIGFNMAEKFPLLLQKIPIDIVFTMDENEWNGEKTLQLKVIDFRLS